MNNTVKKQTIQEKRTYLKELSAGFLQLKKDGVIKTVNSELKTMYAQQGHITLKTYDGWQKEGFQVKKGETALLLWGRPQEEPENIDRIFFPLSFLFSNLQVYNLKKIA